MCNRTTEPAVGSLRPASSDSMWHVLDCHTTYMAPPSLTVTQTFVVFTVFIVFTTFATLRVVPASLHTGENAEPLRALVLGTGSSNQLSTGSGDACHIATGKEYGGDVVVWGAGHLKESPSACCEACRATPKCNTWVWCEREGGCGPPAGGRAHGECWLKVKDQAAMPVVLGETAGWTSGAIFSAEEAAAADAIAAAVLAERALRRDALGNARVFFDIEIDGAPAGRIEMALYSGVSPRSAENFRLLCTGEKGSEARSGKRYSFEGQRFYRILDAFIDQSGQEAAGSALTGASFDDDAGGLRLQHDRPGLLSMANSGKNTNTGHFSILMAPAPHLDGSYTIFGEVVSGMATARAINALASPSGAPTGSAIIVKSGQLKR